MSFSSWKFITTIGVLFFLTISSISGQAPGCPNVTAGPDTTLPCGATCTDLTASLLETGATTSYSVSSVPYSPPFSFTGGTSIFIGIDDQWSNIVNLPFNFCFYGNTYNQLIIGANGLISFNITMANTWCEWLYTASIPTPGPPSAGIYNNSINGAYHDIDPSVFWTGAGNDINFAVLGSPPCRTVVINYYDVPQYSCNNLTSTQQIVLYETTNVIEVYISSKPTCNFWNSGNAVIGIQNANGSAGVTPPGRNTGNWSAYNEAWRFTPNGPPNYQIDWYDTNNNMIGTGNPFNVCPLGNSSYIVKATYTNCDGSTVIEIDTTNVIFSGPYIDSVTDPSCNIGCDGSASVGIINGVPPYTYIWAPSGGTSSTGTSLCAGTNYTVTIIDATSNTCSIPFYFNTQFVFADIPTATNPSCAGASDGTAMAIGIGGTAPYTYSWAPSGGNTTTGTGLSGGITYTITITDSAGCFSTDTITLQDPLPLSASITYMSNPSCDTSNDGTALVTPSGGTGAYTYSWSPSGGTSAYETGLSGGVPYIVIVTDLNGCTATDSTTLVSPQPLVSVIIATDDPKCTTSNDGSATVSVSGGTGAYTYLWSPSGGTGNIGSNLSGGILYTVNVTDSSGCLSSVSVTLNTPPPLLANITDSINPSCGTSTDGSATVSASGGTGVYTYSWSPSGGNGSVGTGLSGGVFYSVVVTDANGCTSADIITLVAPPPLIATISGSTPPSCFNTSDGDASVNVIGGLGGYTYQWSPSGGNGQTGTNLSGGILYTVLVSDSIGCTSTDTLTINAPLAMLANITSTDPSCDTSSDGNITIIVTNGVGPYTYLWNPSGNTSNALSGLPDGTYTMIATDANGCILTTQVDLIAPPTLVATISGLDTICEGDRATISITPSGGTPAYSFNWTPSGNATASNIFSPDSATTYSATITDANGCLYNVMHIVEVNKVPIVDFTSDIIDGCEPLEVLFTNTSPNIVASSWDLGNGSSNSNIPFLHNYDNFGSYDITLLVTDTNGCKNSITMLGYINVYPNPNANFSAEPWSGTTISPTIYFYDQSSYSASWIWQFDTLGADTIENPSFTFPTDDTGTYNVHLWVNTEYGCLDSITKVVSIKGDFIMFVPNTFTPNGSGLNDGFIPIGYRLDYSRLELWIFNRWGEEIYYTNRGIPWDGTDHSEYGKEQMDVYVWMTIYRDEYRVLHQAIGHVTVLK